LKVLLDENFPLALLRSLLRDGQEAEHIITMGWRGASDQRIRERLLDGSVLFLTRDEDFLLDLPAAAIVVLSRVKQSRRLEERVQVWDVEQRLTSVVA
jgi:predicted nuclease of predicted toxin-antitoxin system